MNKGLLLLLFLAVAARAPAAADPVFTLRGDRLGFRSDGMGLGEFLLLFHEAGVRVRMDPGLAEERVAGSVDNLPVEDALDLLAGAFDTAMFWTRIEGPLGPLDRLTELWLFRRGQPGRAAVLGSRRLVVTGTEEGRHVQGEILLGFREGITREEAEALLRGIGGEIVGGIQGAYRVRLPPGARVPEIAALLARDPRVAVAEPNFVYGLPGPPAMPAADRAAPRSFPGPGETAGAALLAVLDSGVRSLEGLDAWIAGRHNALEPGGSPEDTAGHGTQMALVASGLVLPDGMDGQGIENRKVLSIKGFDEAGWTSSWAVLEALGVAEKQGVRVMNLSWGSETPSEFLRRAFDQASRNGLLLVAAAGNQATGRPVYPAAFPGILAVGAAREDGSPSAYSNFGPFVSLSAPGQAAFPVGHDGPPGAYAGTSIASAFTAGILAEYLSRNPEASSRQAAERLLQSLSPLPGGGQGAGVLDSAAVRRFLGP